MKKLQCFLEDKVLPVAALISGQRHLLALRDGLIMAMPLMIISSFFIIISQFPIPGYKEFMISVFGEAWTTWELGIVRPATMNLIAVVATMGVSSTLVKSYGKDGTSAGFLSLAAYLVLTPLVEGNAWGQGPFGAQGLFMAMIVGLLVGETYRLTLEKNWTIKMPPSVPPAISRSFEALIPAGVIITGSLLIRILVGLTSFGSVQNFIYQILQQPLTKAGTSLPGTLVAQFFNSFFWGLGLHGGQLVKSVMLPIWTTQMADNLNAYTMGMTVMPNIVTKQFIELFTWVGGSAGTLSLTVWMVLFAKSKQVKEIGKLAIGPAIFNINEPVIFGLPIALNPIMIIPFILAPMATITFSYLTMSMGLFPIPVGIDMPWTTPVLISGYISTGGNLMGVVLQLLNFLISLAVYYPFISIYDKQKLKEEQNM